MLTDQVGVLLKRSRKALRLTQKELAQRAGVSERLWAEVERAERPNVSLETALRMLSLVGVSIRLDDPLGTTHVLHDASSAAAARAARAAIRRTTWRGRQTRLSEEGTDVRPPADPAQGVGAVARVSEQAFAVANARRGSRR
ncbi:MAG: helix-turn-helix transcriptional regulator [Gemmatimonadetes bacterium]|nr:helix-turn-helix transcriptional regulator [Gemmatimonadota bacterium]MCC6774246.1 helix-turn-helix transcriptional regulator [Gemmatimonadaceae bacterium]